MKPLERNQTLQPCLPSKCNVKLIGLGGVGGIVARYGAVWLAAEANKQGKDARLVLIDGDKFEPSNASRMLFGTHGNKAAVTHRELKPRFKNSKLTIETVKSYVRPDNIKQLIRSGDIVLLCVDNHATRKMIDEHCAKLQNICLISGGNDGVGPDSTGAVRRGTYVSVQVHLKQKGQPMTTSMQQFHPEIANPADKMPHQMNCTDLVMSTPQVLFANLAAASGILNALLLFCSNVLHYQEVSADIAEALMRPTLPLKTVSHDKPKAKRKGSATAVLAM